MSGESRIRIYPLWILAAVVCWLTGCASVEGTRIYYVPYTLEQYPPKPKDAFIPIVGKAPDRPHRVIGRLAFSSTLGYRFMRRSIEYNARMAGADAVVLKEVDENTQFFLTQVPPRWDYIPYTSWAPYVVRTGDGRRTTQYATYTSWQPIFRPGYVAPQTITTTAIDVEMIRFKN